MTAGPWWHAYGRVRELGVEVDGTPVTVWQLVVISPSSVPPTDPQVDRTVEAWGDYLTSWDHEPSDAEKDAVTPEEFRDEDDDQGEQQ